MKKKQKRSLLTKTAESQILLRKYGNLKKIFMQRREISRIYFRDP
jgi:hypothetical protein